MSPSNWFKSTKILNPNISDDEIIRVNCAIKFSLTLTAGRLQNNVKES